MSNDEGGYRWQIHSGFHGKVVPDRANAEDTLIDIKAGERLRASVNDEIFLSARRRGVTIKGRRVANGK